MKNGHSEHIFFRARGVMAPFAPLDLLVCNVLKLLNWGFRVIAAQNTHIVLPAVREIFTCLSTVWNHYTTYHISSNYSTPSNYSTLLFLELRKMLSHTQLLQLPHLKQNYLINNTLNMSLNTFNVVWTWY